MRIKDIHMNKRVKFILIGLAIVVVAGGVTAAALVRLMPKENTDQSATPEKTAKQKADDASSKAKDLLDETAKLGSGREADKKTQEAAAQFEEASKLQKEAGDNAASYEAQANADALASRLAAEEASKKQLEAEQAQQRAALEAAKAAFQAGGQ